MIHGSTRHPYGARAALDGVIVFMLVLFASAFGAPHGRVEPAPFTWLAVHVSVSTALLALGVLFCRKYSFGVLGLDQVRFVSLSRQVISLITAAAVTSMLLYALLLASRSHGASRTMVTFFVLAVSYDAARVLLCAGARKFWFSRHPRRIIILGSGRRASTAWRELRTRNHGSATLLGFVDHRDVSEMAPDVASRYLGSPDTLRDLMLHRIVDTIVIAMPAKSCYAVIQQAIDLAEEMGVRVIYLNDVFRSSADRRTQQTNGPLVSLNALGYDVLLHRKVKRALDVLGASVGLVVSAPLMFVIAVAVKAFGSGEVFFRQERVGYYRRSFRMVKFCTAASDAPAVLSGLLKGGARITPLGSFLRATSLDELPQLWNVLMGDMSLVGPRPMSVREMQLLSNAALVRRFSVKPGLTGLWQVNARSGATSDQRMHYDNHYIDHWSLVLDVKILVRTLSAMTRRSGVIY